MGLVNLLAMEENGTASHGLRSAALRALPMRSCRCSSRASWTWLPSRPIWLRPCTRKPAAAFRSWPSTRWACCTWWKRGDTVHSLADLKGRTILSTGKGTTPEYVLRYLLNANGLDPDKDVTIEYYSEASEVTAQMAAARKDAIAVLPQPLCHRCPDEGQRPPRRPGT